MAERWRGAFWQEEEDECLLEVLEKMDAGKRVRPSTHFPNISLFNEAGGRQV